MAGRPILCVTLHERHGRVAFTGDTPEQLVEQLRRYAFVTSATTEAYMEDVARGAKIQVGCVVRTDTARHFLEDLATAGLLSVDWGEDQ